METTWSPDSSVLPVSVAALPQPAMPTTITVPTANAHVLRERVISSPLLVGRTGWDGNGFRGHAFYVRTRPGTRSPTVFQPDHGALGQADQAIAAYDHQQDE